MSDNFLKIVKVQNSDGTYSDAINIVTDGDYVTCYNGNDLNTNLRTLFSAEGSSMTNTSDIKDNVITFTSADASSPSNFLSVDVFTTGSKSSVLFNNISKMSSNIRFLNNNKLDKTGDAKSNVVTFISDDTQSPGNFLSMNVLSSGSTIASLFNSMSKMASNIRFLNNNRVDNRYISTLSNDDGILVHNFGSNNGIKIFNNGNFDVSDGEILNNKNIKLIASVGDTGSHRFWLDTSANAAIHSEFRITTSLHDSAFVTTNSGNTGLHSYTKSKWIIYMDTEGRAFLPANTTCIYGIGTGGKTVWNDTQHAGTWITSAGEIHISKLSGGGGLIGFHFNGSASSTTTLSEASSGVLTCSGRLLSANLLVTTIIDIITVNSNNATINEAKYVQNGKVAQIYIKWTNVNNITVPAVGNIENLSIGTLVSGKRPSIVTGGYSIGDNAGAAWYCIETSGNVRLDACEGLGDIHLTDTPNRTINAGSIFHMCATYILP